MTAFVISNAGGNFNAAASYVANSGTPVAGDTITATASSGNLTVTATAACASIDFSNYTHTFTINNAIGLTLTSTFKMVSGMSVGGTGNLILNGTLTMTSGGKQPAWNVTLQGANTYTLGDAWQILATTLTCGSGANAIVINGNTFTVGGTLTCGTSSTISGTTKLVIGGTNWSAASAGTYQNNIDINAGVGVTIGANVKYSTGTLTWVASGSLTGTLTIPASCTLTLGASAGAVLASLTISAAATITLGAELWVSGTTTLPNANVTFTGAFDIHCMGTLTNTAGNGRTYTFPINQTLHIGDSTSNGSFTIQSNTNGHMIIKSGTGGTTMKLKVWGGATMAPIYCDFTDVDASQGQSVFTFGGTLSNTTNIFNTFPPSSASENAEADTVSMTCGALI